MLSLISLRCPDAQADLSLRCPHEESLGPYLSTERTAKTLIRLIEFRNYRNDP